MRNLLILLMALNCFQSNAQIIETWLGTKMDGNKLLQTGTIVETWGYGFYSPGIWAASLPAPLLEYTKNDSVSIYMINDSPEDHTIHLHGLDVSTLNDGVPSTSFAVDPYDTAQYNFVANNSGIYLYHCHVLTTLHLTMGMYGMIIIHEDDNQNILFQGGPSYQTAYNFLSSDMDESLNVNPLSPGPFNELDVDYFMVNGNSGNQLYNHPDHHVTAYTGDSVLMRLGSMAYSKTRYIFPPELNAIAYTSDGRELPNPFNCDTLVIHSGERYQVLLTPTANVDTDIIVESIEMRNNQIKNTNLIKLNGDLSFGEYEENSFEIYPNPSNGSFKIGFSKDIENAKMVLCDIQGKVVYSNVVSGISHQVEVETDAGIYFVRVTSDDGTSMTEKLILN